MSFLLRTLRQATPARAAVQARAFSVSSTRALKEGTQNTNEEGAAEHNEHHKQDQLKKQKEGKGHWKPELASQSEEAVSFISSVSFVLRLFEWAIGVWDLGDGWIVLTRLLERTSVWLWLC